MTARRLRVLDLRDTTEIGGPGKTILETFRAIDASQFELHLGVFLARDESEDSPFINAARELAMPVHLIRGYNQYDPRLITGTASLVKRLGIDIVHAHEVKSDVIAYLATFLHNVPIVTTLHGWIGNSRKQRAMIALDRLVARRYDRVIAVSTKIREELLAAGVPEKSLRLVHNGIVLDKYRRTGANGYLRELTGRAIPAPVLVSIGRLSAEKGHADLVEALGLVAKRGGRVSAVFAGDGPERGRLERRIDELNLRETVHLPGYISQPARVLEEADLMVLPSHTEGLPNAALEALMMEVPVLATRVGGTPEVITDGDTGRLVPSRAPEAMASAIEEFLANPPAWKQMAERGKRMVERQFDFRTRTRSIESIYTEMARA